MDGFRVTLWHRNAELRIICVVMATSLISARHLLNTALEHNSFPLRLFLYISTSDVLLHAWMLLSFHFNERSSVQLWLGFVIPHRGLLQVNVCTCICWYTRMNEVNIINPSAFLQIKEHKECKNVLCCFSIFMHGCTASCKYKLFITLQPQTSSRLLLWSLRKTARLGETKTNKKKLRIQHFPDSLVAYLGEEQYLWITGLSKSAINNGSITPHLLCVLMAKAGFTKTNTTEFRETALCSVTLSSIMHCNSLYNDLGEQKLTLFFFFYPLPPFGPVLRCFVFGLPSRIQYRLLFFFSEAVRTSQLGE